MSEKFYEVCYNCQRTFTDRAEYEEHKRSHGKGKAKVETEKTVEKKEAKAPVDESAKAAAVSEVNMMKKLLAAAGIEAQTMTAEQVRIRYAEEKAKGNVR
jgi:hypothetical protein